MLDWFQGVHGLLDRLRLIGSVATASSSAELSPMTTSSSRRARIEKGDDIVLRIIRSTSSYSYASFLEGVGTSLLLPKDERRLNAIGSV